MSLPKAKVHSNEGCHQHVTFMLGSVDYGIEIISVQERKGYGGAAHTPTTLARDEDGLLEF